MRQAGSVVSPCPKCGSALEFDTDGGGYGMTIEQCSAGCGHWRTLEKIQPAAHVKAPWGAGPKPRTKRRLGEGKTSVLLIAALPTSPGAALRPWEIAERVGHDKASTCMLLAVAAKRGQCERVGSPRAWRYWRRPA